MNRAILPLFAASLAVLAGCGETASILPPPPSPVSTESVPRGWTMTRVPSIDYGDYTMAQATSWCEGATRVHALVAFGVVGSEQGSHLVQDLEPNAATCAPGAAP